MADTITLTFDVDASEAEAIVEDARERIEAGENVDIDAAATRAGQAFVKAVQVRYGV